MFLTHHLLVVLGVELKLVLLQLVDPPSQLLLFVKAPPFCLQLTSRYSRPGMRMTSVCSVLSDLCFCFSFQSLQWPDDLLQIPLSGLVRGVGVRCMQRCFTLATVPAPRPVTSSIITSLWLPTLRHDLSVLLLSTSSETHTHSLLYVMYNLHAED